mmetsp:Transcript_37632/g.60386  ORF Transcript_37632/g.60386 Transcript_37632/m.60386 type:complete len:133 (-) Transcript_37632:216-614(-)
MACFMLVRYDNTLPRKGLQRRVRPWRFAPKLLRKRHFPSMLAIFPEIFLKVLRRFEQCGIAMIRGEVDGHRFVRKMVQTLSDLKNHHMDPVQPGFEKPLRGSQNTVIQEVFSHAVHREYHDVKRGKRHKDNP